MVATQSSRNCDLSLLGLQLISDPETYTKYLVGFRFRLEFRILIAVRNESIGTMDLASKLPTKLYQMQRLDITTNATTTNRDFDRA